jgi:hypothetical protein
MKLLLVPPRIAVLYTPFVSFLGIGRLCSRCRRDLVSRWPHPACHRLAYVSSPDSPVGQITPDKDVNFRDATAAFTVSPESRALPCGADLPEDSALYAVSVRRLIALRSGFLWTVPRGSALAFSWYLCKCDKHICRIHVQRTCTP